MQYFQIGDILMPSGYSREFCWKTGEREMKKVTDSREFSKPGSRFPNLVELFKGLDVTAI